MGLSLSLLSKFGMTGISSQTTEQFYKNFFEKKKMEKFDDFHIAFIDLCKFLNDVMPGKHFKAPPSDKIEEFYNGKWSKIKEEDKRKEELKEFVKEYVEESKTGDKAVIFTGMVVPAAAVALKNSAESFPQVKRFKLHLIPNFVFAPTCTFLAIAGVQLMQLNTKSKQGPSSQGNHPGPPN